MKPALKSLASLLPFALVASLTPAAAQDEAAGAALYRQHCATCHGIDGMGDGPMAGVLLIKPGDLSLLQTDNDGVFPADRVARRIDGRDPLVSHGSPMPVYGSFFEGEDVPYRLHSGQTMLTSRPIVDLLAYLESLQNI